MSWQQFSGSLEGLRFALQGGTPDPDGVLWNTDGAAQYVADILQGVALLDTYGQRQAIDFDAPEFQPSPGGSLAFKPAALLTANVPALLTGLMVYWTPQSAAADLDAIVYSLGADPFTPGRLLQTFDRANAPLTPLPFPDGTEGTLLVPQLAFSPTWIYPDQVDPTSFPQIGVAVQSDQATPPADLSVRVIAEVARVRSLPLVPPFPR